MMVQNFLIGLAYYSIMYYLPIFYQTARQMTVIQSALLILPIVLPQSLASVASGQYMSRTNRYGEVIWVGFSLWVIAAAVESRFSRDFPLAGIIVTLIAQGMGVGFTFQPSEFCVSRSKVLYDHSGYLLTLSCTALVAAQAHSAKQDRAVVISSRNFLRALGGAAGRKQLLKKKITPFKNRQSLSIALSSNVYQAADSETGFGHTVAWSSLYSNEISLSGL